VAAQLAALADLPDGWMYDWLAGAARHLLDEAPLIAEDLLRRAVDQVAADDARRPDLAATLADVLLRLGRNADAETYARSAIVPGGDPDRTARMRWVIAYLLMRTGRGAEAATGLAHALGDPELPDRWRARLLALVAMMQAAGGDDLDAAEERARQALALGEAAGDRFAVGCALQALSIGYAIRRDEVRRLECVDRALAVLGDDPDCTDLRLLHLANRLYSLSILDRMAEAEETLVTLLELAEGFGDARLASLHHPAATLHFFRGRWDDALAELDAISDVPEDAAVTGMVHGLAALIAARRDDREAAAAHLAAVADEPLDNPRARANGLPLLTARAVTAERDGDPAAALAVLRPLLDDEWAQSERHLLLPELARLAVGLDDLDTARRALAVCETLAAADPTASRRAAVDRCRGQLDGDPDPVLAAAAHYRAVGRVAELATALEDAAVLLARRGDERAARTAFGEAGEIYAKLGALWDQRRADARIRRHGIRRGTRGPRNRPRYGWEALSPTELMIADLVAKGASNPDIAAELLLSRRTVQSHVSHILQKLNVRSRVEIARETVAHSARS
jgi:DNA-binding CsgD family transcriptional regulator